jgi:hypothetical protein
MARNRRARWLLGGQPRMGLPVITEAFRGFLWAAGPATKRT